MMIKLVAPSLLSADFGHLADEIDMVNRSEADWLHVDVMDGVFVPNISIGLPVLKHIKRLSEKPLDVHLMIIKPENYLKQFRDNGADILTVHIEASTHLHRTVQMIKDLGMKAGVALNPHTPVSQLEEILPELDLVLIMSVNPGFGGQKFIPGSVEKIRRLVRMIEKLSPANPPLIEVDGGVSAENAATLFQAGVNVLVAGNAVFASDNPAEMIQKLKRAAGK
ncbi:MAG: ribulose-phosphate 3-epimerase [Bacteroidales bacterium]